MRILSLRISGYRFFKDDFAISFLTSEKVFASDLSSGVRSLQDKLYMNCSVAMIGSNSSGKTSLLDLLNKCYSFLLTGRWMYEKRDFKSDHINLFLCFYNDGKVFKYECCLSSPLISPYESSNSASYITGAFIDKERMFFCLYKPSYRNDLDKVAFKEMNLSKRLSDLAVFSDYFHFSNDVFYLSSSLEANQMFELAFNKRREIPPQCFSLFLKLMDDSIEDIGELSIGKAYYLKRYGEEKIVLKAEDLLNVISEGTIRGVLLLELVYLSLKIGGVLIVDEIERSFHKNVVDNIILLFNDKKTNKFGATLFFSTHYAEIIDSVPRRDAVFILHKKDMVIDNISLYNSGIRTELSKSRQINSNAFNTLLNYDLLMEMTELIQKEQKRSE